MSKTKSCWPFIGAGLGAASIAAGGALTLARTRKQRHHEKTSVKASREGPRIVILGAGFAGLTTAEELSRHEGREASITLVDRHNYHLFTPMLYQVASLGVGPYTVAFPTRQFSGGHNVAFRLGTVTGVDFDAKKVQLGDDTLEYDYLAIALGTTTNFYGNQSAQEHAFPLKWLEEGISIRNHVLDTLEQAALAKTRSRDAPCSPS